MTVDKANLKLYSILEVQGLETEITNLQELIFDHCWQGKTYGQIAEELGYDHDYIRQIGSQIWQLLSTATQKKITKTNFKSVLSHHQKHQQGQGASNLKLDHNQKIIEWGEAVKVPFFYDRDQEINLLKQWILDENCRLINLLAMGGMGKSALSIKLFEQIQEEFDFLVWKSLRDAPTLENLLDYLIKILAKQEITKIPENIDEKIKLLLTYLETSRCFIVLDNFESIFQSGEDQIRLKSGQYLEGYENYEILLQRVIEKFHSSCFLLTSREEPQLLNLMVETNLPVQVLKLTGLNEVAGQEIVKVRGETKGSESEWKTIIRYYAGNPLALKMVAPIVQDYFEGSLTQFLNSFTEEALPFNDIQVILEQQFIRLSEPEKMLMYWLAVVREQVSFPQIKQNLHWLNNSSELIQVIRSLERRSLIEKSSQGFTQQPVVMEYVTKRFLEEIEQEIETEQIHYFNSHPLMQATAKDYVRASQIRMIITPLLKKLRHQYGDPEKKLQQVLSKLQQDHCKDGYSAGNVLNLLVHLGIDLSGYNFSHLAVWEVALQNVNLQNVDLTGADLSRSLFCQTFNSLLSVTFSPDSDFLVAGDMNNEILVYEKNDEQVLRRLKGHQNLVWCVAFSPDGTRLASGSVDQTIRIWDFATGECLQVLRGHESTIHESTIMDVAFDASGTILASGSDDQTIRLWDFATGECLQVLQGHESIIFAIAFDASGKILFSGSLDGKIKFWDITTGECFRTLTEHTDAVWSLAYLSNDATLVSASYDRTIKQWDVETGKCLQTLVGHSDQLYSVTVSPDQNRVASAGGDSTIKIWDLSTGRCQKTLFAHQHRIFDLAWSPNGKYLASGGQDRFLKLWDASSGECLKALRGYTNGIWSVSFHQDGKTLASGSDDGLIRFWDAETGQCKKEIAAHNNFVHSTIFNPSGKYLASSSPDCTVKLWDVDTGQNLHTLPCYMPPNYAIAFHPTDKFLVSIERNTILCLSDVQTGQVQRRLEGHKTVICSVAFSQDGMIMASSSIDGMIIVWDLSTFAKIRAISSNQGWIWSSCFQPQEKILVTGGRSGTVVFWDVGTGESVGVIDGFPKGDFAIAFQPQGDLIAIGSANKTIQLWDFQTKQLVQTLSGHEKAITSVSFHPQGNLLASSSLDETIKIWELLSGNCLKTLQIPRPYENMNISEVTGLSQSAIANLKALGAVVDKAPTS